MGEPKTSIQHDGTLTIAVGRSRKETNWKNRQMLWSELVERFSRTIRTSETYNEYRSMSKKQQDEIKDVGGFVGGALQSGRRKRDTVSWRHLLTLDADHVRGDLWASVEALLGCGCAMYSTHSHTPRRPRLRLVIPLSRAVTADEYQAVARRVAADLGIDFFDDTTYEPHRLMYWPSTASDGEFVFRVLDEAWLDPDEMLERYPDWKDPSFWPESSRVKRERRRMADKQGDPHEKPGVVGAFCRTYSIEEAIETFLSDVYEPAQEGRYTYKPGTTSGGLVVYDEGKFAYSHHATDPISGRLVNAFDLVRLHKFGIRDEDAAEGTPVVRLPSYMAMQKLAAEDEHVRQKMGEEQLSAAREEFGDTPDDTNTEWLKRLRRHSKSGKILPTAPNMILILQNDPRLKGKIALNEFSHRPVLLGDVPWRKKADGENWRDSDDAGLRNYLENVYEITGPGKVHDALQEVMNQNKFHPVRDYLNGLEWDGIPRLDTLLIDYLGAEDTTYVRAVTRKALAGAVARVMQPGIKFDYMLVMVGPQGIGKSLILNKLGQRWFSDSITTVQGKEAYEQLQGAWIIEMGELSATRKADVEAIKHFLSKQEDAYRVAYGRQISVFPRQCVFIGTTNDSTFLRDRTGNRRFWPVDVGKGERKKNLWTGLDQHEIDQIWAEAVEVRKEGEKLYLVGELEAEALKMQELHSEESEKFGMVQEYLETLLPENWADMDIGDRRRFIHGTEFGGAPEGTIQRDRVCAMEIWVELFQSDPKQLTPILAREINDILRNMPGWEPYTEGSGKLRFGNIYGLQRAFVREGFSKN